LNKKVLILSEAVGAGHTKAGGLTCFEALAKKLPLFIYRPLPGHEEGNSDFLISRKLAVRINTEEEIDGWMRKRLEGPQGAAFLIQNMTQFRQTMDPLATAKSVLNFIEVKRENECFLS
jgi:processive 1,2-diacylglycerol beta-glucosyltransferase